MQILEVFSNLNDFIILCDFPVPGKPSCRKAAGHLASQLTELREGHRAAQPCQDQGAGGNQQRQLCSSALGSAGLVSGNRFKTWTAFRAQAEVAFRTTIVCTLCVHLNSSLSKCLIISLYVYYLIISLNEISDPLKFMGIEV